MNDETLTSADGVRDEFKLTQNAARGRIPKQKRRKVIEPLFTVQVPPEAVEYAKNLCRDEGNRKYRLMPDGSILILNQ